MSFQQGLSGLNASSKALDVTGNNIANASTVGFKNARAEFADVFAASLSGGGTNAVGIGTLLSAVTTQFTQGNISITNNSLDLAINGKGFFRMSNNGSVSYSRAGQFGVDKSGFMQDNAGRHLTGFATDANGIIVAAAPVDIQLSAADIPAKVTANANVVMNLDANALPPVTAVFNPADATSFNNASAITVYDTLGASHVLQMFMVKTAAAGGWDLHTTVDGTAEVNVALGSGVLQFDGFGALTSPTPTTVSVDLNAVAAGLVPPGVNSAISPLDFNLDFSGSTQFASQFGVNSIDQDGYASGRLTGVSIARDGIVQGRYTNGQSRDLAQVVLANFTNPQGLTPLGGNQFGETAASGSPLIGAPDTGSLGALQSGANEESNVDLTAELVNLITQQRIYQANAQTIKTQDAVLQTLVNIR